MIAYTMVGTRNLEKALAFYRPLFEGMNLELCWRDESCFSYGKTQDLNRSAFCRHSLSSLDDLLWC